MKVNYKKIYFTDHFGIKHDANYLGHGMDTKENGVYAGVGHCSDILYKNDDFSYSVTNWKNDCIIINGEVSALMSLSFSVVIKSTIEVVESSAFPKSIEDSKKYVKMISHVIEVAEKILKRQKEKV